MLFVIAVIVLRDVAPLNAALAAFVGAVAALLFYAFIVQPVIVRRGLTPPPLTLNRFILAVALLMLGAAGAWQTQPGVSGALAMGMALGATIAGWLPRRAA